MERGFRKVGFNWGRLKMQNVKIQDMNMQNLKMLDTKTDGIKQYCFVALNLPGASWQRCNLV